MSADCISSIASVGGVGNCIIVDIIDACPSESAYNYCKTDVPANERCGASGTNQLGKTYFDAQFIRCSTKTGG
jgi:hypothetical protein